MDKGTGVISWPEGKRFAFTVFDDTDFATLKNVQPVYAFLNDAGFRTTKSVWPLRGSDKPVCGGSTCEDPKYLRWLLRLQREGFEMSYHLATFHSVRRDETIRSLDRFENLFGATPTTMTNHVGCLNSLYWGSYRISGAYRHIYNALTGFRRMAISAGHIDGDPHFWGDFCKARIRYVRNFVFKEINTLKVCPMMPYHDPERPYVHRWFASSDGAEIRAFNHCISEAAQDRLEEEGGACIMYTHFASGFARAGRVNVRFRQLMERLRRKNGWFVPVSTLLDFLAAQQRESAIDSAERTRLERRWLWQKIKWGTT